MDAKSREDALAVGVSGVRAVHLSQNPKALKGFPAGANGAAGKQNLHHVTLHVSLNPYLVCLKCCLVPDWLKDFFHACGDFLRQCI